MEEIRYFNPWADIEKHGLDLPHWEQPGGSYFITFRLADSIPQEKLECWMIERDRWLAMHPKPWNADQEAEYHKKFSSRIEKWLDQGLGECVLRQSNAAQAVRDVLMAFNGTRYQHHAWVIMPNHVHLLVSLAANTPLDDSLKAWKGASARAVNLAVGRSGTLWQENYFDRLIRDSTHFFNAARYIRRNPTMARLQTSEYLLWESDWVQHLLG